MKTRLGSIVVATIVILLASLPAPLQAQDPGTPAPIGLRPDAPPYALHGPYWVGTQTIEMDAGTENALRFTVWYPALNPDGLEESVVYQMSENHILHSMIPADNPFTVLGHALENAAPDLSGAPYPLVIHSHGFTAQMWHVYFGEHLASYGFVVIAPEHAADDWANVYTSMAIRLIEITRTINDAEILTADGGTLAGMIDTERIAAGGVSAGGMTAYGAGGAPIDWTIIEQYCTEVPDDPACTGTDLATQQQAIIELLGTEVGPDGLLPVVWDSRVDAIFPMAGTMEMHGPKGLAAITIPMMTFYGSVDPAASWETPAYDEVSSQQKAEVVFKEAGHNMFDNECEAFPYIVQYDLYWGCSDPVWDLERAHDLVNHFITAFLLDVLKGDADAHAALSPDAVSFPGIEYQAEGY